MAKRKNEWTEGKIARYYKDGRGNGELNSYKPWLTVQDVSSQGRSHRIKGWKTERIHHFFSDLERNFFYLLEWADDVIDIREQYPIDREHTLKIAEQMNIKHPVDPNTHCPIVMTSDFFIVKRVKNEIIHVIRSIKPSEKLNDKRTIEKLEIERRYWQEYNVEWKIVTEKDIPNEIIENIRWIHSFYHIPKDDNYQYLNDLSEYLMDNNGVAKTILKQFNDIYGLENGSSLSLFKHMLARKIIKYDITKKVKLTDNLQDLIINETNKRGD